MLSTHAPSFLHFYLLFFFNDTATTEIYTLSLHDALPIYILVPEPIDYPYAALQVWVIWGALSGLGFAIMLALAERGRGAGSRSEEHTSELQSQSNLVCRLLLEKKKKLLTTSITQHDAVDV